MRLLFLAAIAPFALVAAAPASAQIAADTAEIRAFAAAFDDAQLHGDGAALERMLAPDYLLVRGSGRVGDRRDFIAGFTDPAARLSGIAITDRMFLRVSPDVAIVGGEASVTGTDHGKPFAEHFRYADTFARRGGRWYAVFTQVTPLGR